MSEIKPNIGIVELFSGIGSQAKALKNIGYNVTALGTCEWDLHAFIAYDAIHNSPELPDDIVVMKKDELLEKLKRYTLSNSGKEKMDFTIDLLITMVVEEIAEDSGKESKDILADFLCSKTGKALYDKETRLWCNGPSYIAEVYMEEISNK